MVSSKQRKTGYFKRTHRKDISQPKS